MAKLQLYLQHSDLTSPFGDFNQPILGRHGGDFAEFEETGTGANGDIFIFKGKNLIYDDGFLVSGTITGATLVNSEGSKYAKITGLDLSVRDLPTNQAFWGALVGEAMVDQGNDVITGSSAADALHGMRGNDIIKALGGDDIIFGDKGKDTITTGSGEDIIAMLSGDGKDVITDFELGMDTLGGDTEFKLHKAGHGKDTLVEFDGGYSALLLGVKKGQIDDGDIMMIT